MTSFLATTFAVIAHQPETICAILATSREIMNCSAVPVTLSTDETWYLLCWNQPTNERKLLQLFSTFSDTMQFTEKLRIRNRRDKYFDKSILENLIKNKRYFSRTIRLLEVPSADTLIKACCSDHHSSTTSAPKLQLLSNLRSLSIGDCDTLRNEELKTVCSLCPFLEILNIPWQQKFSDDGAEFLSNLRRLQSLDLGCCKITDTGLEHLAKLSSLRSLHLWSCNEITDSGLEHLAKLTSLQTLTLDYCDKITGRGLRHLAELSSLQTLDLRGCGNITDSGLQHLAKLSTLRSLDLYSCEQITDDGLEHLAKLSSLRSLNLGWCKSITDSGLQHLVQLSSLQSLDLDSCDTITDEGCRVFPESTEVNR